jgi:hypothetical protein
MMATPPFGAPDEQAHYLRALTIANGAILGPKVAYHLPGLQTPTPAWQRQQQAWASHDTRAVHVPAKLSPPEIACLNGRPDITKGGCYEATPTGDYPPVAYLLPAAALRFAHNPTTGDWLARIASAIPVAVFLLIAVALISPLGSWALLGLLTAVTPMVLFVGSVLNPSGLGIAASLACAAAALRIAVDHERVSGWIWVALIVSGVVAILSWQLGAWFVLVSLLVAVVMAGPRTIDGIRAWSRWAASSAFVLLAAFGLSIAYGVSSGLFHGALTLSPVVWRIRGGFSQLTHWVLPDAIGDFGWQTIRLPTPAYWIWWLLGLALVGGALVIGERRHRVAVCLALLVALGFPVLFYAFSYSNAGFGMQGRQVLPLLMLVPLVAGVVLQRSTDSRSEAPSALVPVAIAAVGAFQLFAWWVNARHSAGEPNAVWFLAHPMWSPPGGWWPWTALVLAGSASLICSAVRLHLAQRLALSRGRSPRPASALRR